MDVESRFSCRFGSLALDEQHYHIVVTAVDAGNYTCDVQPIDTTMPVCFNAKVA